MKKKNSFTFKENLKLDQNEADRQRAKIKDDDRHQKTLLSPKSLEESISREELLPLEIEIQPSEGNVELKQEKPLRKSLDEGVKR